MTEDAAERFLQLALRALDAAAAHGDGRARHAAAICRGARAPGRPCTNDDAALAEIAALDAQGQGSHAVSIVAKAHGSTPAEVKAIARRLRGKRGRIG